MNLMTTSESGLPAIAPPTSLRTMLWRSAVAVIVLALVAYLPYSLSRKSAIEQLQHEMQGRIDLISETLFATASKYSYLPAMVGDYQLIDQALSQGADPTQVRSANVLLDRLNKVAGSSAIFLLDMNGLVIASSNWNERDSFVGNNYGFRPYFTDAVNKGQGRFYAQGLATKLSGYYISTLVKSEGKPIGVVVAKVGLAAPAANWRTGEAALVSDKNGVIFLSSNDNWRYRSLWPVTPRVAAEIKRTQQYETMLGSPLGIAITQTLGQGERIVTFDEGGDTSAATGGLYFMKSQQLPGFGWEVTMFAPIDAVAMHARRVSMIAVSIAGFLVLLLLYLRQLRISAREQAAARHTLEHAHAELALQHDELQRMTEELHVKSITDGLTGLYNRRHFTESVSQLASAARRYELPLSVLMLDVDHFKQINDTLGHPAGDKVLQALAAILNEEMRDADLLARYGGEEFIVALPHTGAREAEQVAERIRSRVMAHTVDCVDCGDCVDRAVRMTVSVGVSQHLPGESTIEHAIKRADDALYLAKNAGRNLVMVQL